jgi:DNA-binding transcriptional regulator YiaG
MAEKGARAELESIAKRMYVEGKTLTYIGEALGVSTQTVSKWKAMTKAPDEEFDEWDRARQQKRGNIQRLKDLFDRQLEYVEELRPPEVSAAMMDTLSKLGALIERWDKAEQVVRKLDELEKTAEKGGDRVLTTETIRQLREQIGL